MVGKAARWVESKGTRSLELWRVGVDWTSGSGVADIAAAPGMSVGVAVGGRCGLVGWVCCGEEGWWRWSRSSLCAVRARLCDGVVRFVGLCARCVVNLAIRLSKQL